MGMGTVMKRLIGSLLMAGAISVCATDLYGIKLMVGVEDDLSSMIQSLIDGDRESAKAHLEHIGVIAPKLANNLALLDFEIPCVDCAAKRSVDCKVCGGRLLWINPEALNYLEETFKMALENEESAEKAWKFAMQMFKERKALVLSRQSFKGIVLRGGAEGVLLKGADGKIFFLADENLPDMKQGQSFEGTCWFIKELSHSYQDTDGTFKAVPFFTHSLWWDY